MRLWGNYGGDLVVGGLCFLRLLFMVSPPFVYYLFGPALWPGISQTLPDVIPEARQYAYV